MEVINSTTRLHLVGSFYEFYITMHGSMIVHKHVTIIKDYLLAYMCDIQHLTLKEIDKCSSKY
jgi:hypothetical protein